MKRVIGLTGHSSPNSKGGSVGSGSIGSMSSNSGESNSTLYNPSGSNAARTITISPHRSTSRQQRRFPQHMRQQESLLRRPVLTGDWQILRYNLRRRKGYASSVMANSTTATAALNGSLMFLLCKKRKISVTHSKRRRYGRKGGKGWHSNSDIELIVWVWCTENAEGEGGNPRKGGVGAHRWRCYP